MFKIAGYQRIGVYNKKNLVIEFAEDYKTKGMKKSIFILVFLLIGGTTLAQIKKPKLGNTNVNTVQVNQGIKVSNIKNLSTADLSRLNLPTISITDAQKNAKTLISWKLTPNKLKDTYLELQNFFGYSTRNYWEIHSIPMIEGREVTRWNGGFLFLKFRQSLNVEYRLKIKLKGNNYRGQEIYLQIDGFSGRYPINPNDGTVNTVWTASRTNSNAGIDIGQLTKSNGNQDQRRPFPVTKVEYVLIEKISK